MKQFSDTMIFLFGEKDFFSPFIHGIYGTEAENFGFGSVNTV